MRLVHVACVLLFSATAASAQLKPDEPASLTGAVALEKEDPSADELVILGGKLLDFQHFDEAIAVYTKAIQQEPYHGHALANRALGYGWTNRLEEASRDIEAAEELIPNHAIINRVRALIAIRRSDDDAALTELTKSLVKEPENPFSLIHRAWIYHNMGDEAAALADADAYIRARPGEPEAYVLKAELLIAQQQHALARAEAERLTKLFPEHAYSLSGAARIYDALGQRDRALETISKAIAIDPKLFYYHQLRAGFRRWDDFAGRRIDLDAALKLDPNNTDVLTDLGLLDFKEGRWSDAIVKFSAVLSKEPKDFGVLAFRSAAHLQAGNNSLASQDYAAASAAASGASDFDLICRELARQGMALDWALDACNRAVQLKADKSNYRAHRGLVKLRLGRLDEALSDYDFAIAADAEQADAYFGRALVRWRKGDKVAAEIDRKHALTLEPEILENYREYGFTDF